MDAQGWDDVRVGASTTSVGLQRDGRDSTKMTSRDGMLPPILDLGMGAHLSREANKAYFRCTCRCGCKLGRSRH